VFDQGPGGVPVALDVGVDDVLPVGVGVVGGGVVGGVVGVVEVLGVGLVVGVAAVAWTKSVIDVFGGTDLPAAGI
jgi:hypothetical protein